ncbi:metallophosphoesterase family protein [Mesobacillus maritimus]|uniref:DNA repair exonuclease n=1 Tax=Mesobacillus maritimus TaxID=1643336 RepID=A0ABS7JZ17_9BACI|nr:DNA repair exonuclease [Mesobacillus maritimus]MBY0095244.1 DNA repair exonuclease [Mesobacillus maritimus]
MKTVKFLHCADLHLDSPMSGLKYLPEEIFQRLQNSTFKALTNITDIAISTDVDFVLISGDIFDGEDRSLRAQARFRKEMVRLNQNGIQAYIIHGNHDHLAGTWTKMNWPENVHVFGAEVEVKRFIKHDGTTAHLYGFSYPKRHVTERWVEKYGKKTGADFHIGLLHGHVEGVSEHGMYAPFTLPELLQKQFDYWALGHIHKREVLASEPPVIYPGNPQGRNRKENGLKGCYLVSLSEQGADYEFIETNDVLWLDRTLDGSAISSLGSLFDLCQHAVKENRVDGKGVVLTLEIENLRQFETESVSPGFVQELLETLHEHEAEEQDFVWIRDIKLIETTQLQRSQLSVQGEFYHELFTAIDDFEHWEEALSPLYGHHLARKHLSELGEEEKENLLKEAETKLLQLLSQE